MKVSDSKKKIGLFIPCFMNEVYPEACNDVYEVLKRATGYEISYPLEQTCCAQPLCNAGLEQEAGQLVENFIRVFKDFDCIVCPSGSCVSMVKNHYANIISNFPENRSEPVIEDYQKIQGCIYEFCEFLYDVVKVEHSDAQFPHRVGIHYSCHALRDLGVATGSELNLHSTDKITGLLSLVKDIELVEIERKDECCGFGGTFAVTEPDVSKAMGESKIFHATEKNLEYLVGADLSCFMHLEGIAKKNRHPLKFVHVATILNRQPNDPIN